MSEVSIVILSLSGMALFAWIFWLGIKYDEKKNNFKH